MKKDTVVRQLLLLFIASSAAQSVVSSTQGNETDRLSLLEFKKAILLDPQQALTSWNESTNLCDWEGVSCRTKDPRRVVSLRLVNRGLVGQISPWLGNLTFLRNLALPTNTLAGQIPASLGRLRRLQTLVLSNNTMQGTIPSLANYSALKVVWLNNNGLTGIIPEDFPPNIQELQLPSNDIGRTIHLSLANITTLKHIVSMFHLHGLVPSYTRHMGEHTVARAAYSSLSPPQPATGAASPQPNSRSTNNISSAIASMHHHCLVEPSFLFEIEVPQPQLLLSSP